MKYPERFANLPEYAFPRLRGLLQAYPPGRDDHITMTVGEPRHPMPEFLAQVLHDNIAGFARYPNNEGAPDLLRAIAAWVQRRYGVELELDRLMALNGTREGLFNAAIALAPEVKNGQKPIILMPNPFYQVYAIAALTTGSEPLYVNADAQSGYLPDYASLPAAILDRVSIAYVCSPANPQGAIASTAYLHALMELAEKHDFRIFVDECYSEIWRDASPPGALSVAQQGGFDPERLCVFHSLSKRSNLPGLRSGFVAGGVGAISKIRQLRAFAGAPLPAPLQAAAAAAWCDDVHVEQSRALYQEKFRMADAIFAQQAKSVAPEGGFFLWLPVPHTADLRGDGERAAIKLWRDVGVRVLPGAYLSRDTEHGNPGRGYLRIALVGSLDETARGLTLLRDCLYSLGE